jgi:hypothetical protein
MKRGSDVPDSEVIRLYKAGLSCRRIGLMVHLDQTTVSRILHRYHLPLRKPGQHRNNVWLGRWYNPLDYIDEDIIK